MSRTSAIVGACGIGLVLAVGLASWVIWGAGAGNGDSSYDYMPPALRTAHKRALAISAKDTTPEAYTPQDWTDTKAMLSSPDWKIRMRGLTVMPCFKGTAYAAEAWQLAINHLTDPEPVPRLYAADAAAILRPEEAARHIAPLLQDPDKDTRDAVKRVLTRLGYSTK